MLTAGGRSLGNGLQGADLVVGGLQAREQRALGGECGAEFGEVGPAQAVDSGDADAGPGDPGQPVGCVQHRRVLDRARDQVTGPAGGGLTRLHRAEDGQVHGLRPGAGERQFVRPAAELGRHRFPGLVQQQPGPAAFPVQPGRVGPAVIQRREQGVTGARVQRLGRSRVEIRHVPDCRRAGGRPAGGLADTGGTAWRATRNRLAGDTDNEVVPDCRGYPMPRQPGVVLFPRQAVGRRT